MLISIGGAFAMWTYPYSDPDFKESPVLAQINAFTYGLIYISDVSISGGDFESAEFKKSDDCSITAQIKLNPNASSGFTANVTFYNSTNASYYYHKTEAAEEVSGIGFSVSGISERDEIPSKTYKTVAVSISYTSDSTANTEFSNTLNFKFTLDKDSIGGIIAQTVTEKFEEILNDNSETGNTYQELTDAMDNRGTGSFNAASSVTYVGNVAGATSGDSQAILDIFGEEALTMDLDGDGTPEPVTMMIKRENVDNDVTTGDFYSYSNWRGEEITVNGVEMTIYITAENFEGTRRGDSVEVYAAVFTKNPNTGEWVQLVGLTKGTADANNYEGSYFGEVNSFNTDTWRDEANNTIETVVNNAVNYS